MMIGVLAAVALQAGLPQCTATYADVLRETAEVTPAVAELSSAEVGQPILTEVSATVHYNGVRLLEPVTLEGPWRGKRYRLDVPAGDLVREFRSGRYLNVPTRSTFRLEDGSEPRVRPSVDFAVENGRLVGVVDSGFSRTPQLLGDAQFETIECIRKDRSFTRSLSYVGVSRGVISLEYRELSGDLARPAFTQTVTYDLSEGSTVGFRGARLEIISADNLGLRYRILQGWD